MFKLPRSPTYGKVPEQKKKHINFLKRQKNHMPLSQISNVICIHSSTQRPPEGSDSATEEPWEKTPPIEEDGKDPGKSSKSLLSPKVNPVEDKLSTNKSGNQPKTTTEWKFTKGKLEFNMLKWKILNEKETSVSEKQ